MLPAPDIYDFIFLCPTSANRLFIILSFEIKLFFDQTKSMKQITALMLHLQKKHKVNYLWIIYLLNTVYYIMQRKINTQRDIKRASCRLGPYTYYFFIIKYDDTDALSTWKWPEWHCEYYRRHSPRTYWGRSTFLSYFNGMHKSVKHCVCYQFTDDTCLIAADKNPPECP